MDERTRKPRDPSALVKRVLIVDDSRDVALMLKVLLRFEGYETRTAYDGPEAIEAAAEFRPHVVLLDLSLPTLGGAEVAAALRSDPELADCRLLAVSGYGRDSLPEPSPFDHHLTKPVEPDDLLQLLARLADAGAVPGSSRTPRTRPLPA